jgi:perosamine synthetase
MPSEATPAARRPRIALSEPSFGGREWEYLKECLDTGWVSSAGPFVERFERAVADRVGARHAVATSSGTAALHVALLAAGVEADDEVLVSDLTFIAPANAIRYAGAWPVFVDAEATHWQIDPERVESFLRTRCRWRDRVLVNRETGRRVKAVLPVHILGHPAEMEALLRLAREHQLAVIEDATESLGASLDGRPVGTFGAASAFSFNGNKLITTGGGGMVVTDDDRVAERARYLSTQAKDDPVEYVHGTIGFNYRLTNLQAAIGVAQIERIDSHLAAKRQIAARYSSAFAGIRGVSPMRESPRAQSAWWLYTITVDQEQYGRTSRDLLSELRGEGIEARPLWQPLHLSPAHRGRGGDLPCPVAARLYRDALSLPSSVGLTPDDQLRVIDAVARAAAV